MPTVDFWPSRAGISPDIMSSMLEAYEGVYHKVLPRFMAAARLLKSIERLKTCVDKLS